MNSLFKQIRKIHKHDPFDGHVAIETPDDELNSIIVNLHVPEGIHRGATYVFRIDFPSTFLSGEDPPRVFVLSDVYHPNMRKDDSICCNLFKEDWEADTTLESVISTIYCLLENPAFDNPLARGVDEWNYEKEVQRRIE